MKIFHQIEDQSLSPLGSVVTIGNFDGIHVGHQALITHTVEEAKQRGYESIVLTFHPHPLKVLAPERAPRLILSYADKMALFESLGVDLVIAQTFDPNFASIIADEFVRRLLVARLRTKKLWVGRDLRFGRGRNGNVNELFRLASENEFEVGVLDPILLEGTPVSSSRIRRLLEEGRVDQVRPLLGRFHFVSGTVVRGHRRGRQLGFPTANVSSQTEVLPPDGIYATLFRVKNKQRLSVSSIGVNPTFGEGPRTLESFILDFDSDIYDEPVKLAFVKRIREERQFAAVDDLIRQINEDVKHARAIFKNVRVTELDTPSNAPSL
jgi:riboflavin kinase/FMN adenylyltransferase